MTAIDLAVLVVAMVVAVIELAHYRNPVVRVCANCGRCKGPEHAEATWCARWRNCA